ncbi:MAG: TetR/AcrR family transcriptional regulator [Acutalibacteraceae bacterium]
MRKVDIRVKRTYNQLFSALIELLREKSFDDLTVLEICEKAGVHRATFYKHFVDKYDFLNTCFNMNLSNLTFDKIAESYTPETMKKSCMKMIMRVLDFVEENRSVIVSLSTERSSSSFNTALNDAIANFLEERINTVRPKNEKLSRTVPLLANYYAGAIVGIIKWWASDESDFSKQDFLDFAEVKIDDLCNYFDKFI